MLQPRRLIQNVTRFVCPPAGILFVCLSVLNGAEKPAVDRISPPGGQTGAAVAVKLSGKPGEGPLQMWTESGQLQFAQSDKPDEGTLTIPPDASPGIYWVRFFNASGATPLLPFVAGSLPEIGETEPNNKPAEATALDSSAVVVNGILEKRGDVDVFRFSLTKGQTVVLAVQAHRILRSPMDAVLQLIDERGTVLAQNDDDHEMDPLLVFTAPQDAVYLARIFAFPSEPNSSIQFSGAANYVYRLTVSTGPVADHTVPLAVTAGQTAELTVRGWNLNESTSRVSLQTSIDEPSEVRGGSAAPRTAIGLSGPFAVPLTVPLIAHESLSEGSVRDAGIEPDVPFSITGSIDQQRERDSFWFRGVKDQKIRCRAIARAEFSHLDPVLRVMTEDGRELKEADDIGRDNADASLDVTLPADGRYRLEIRDRYDHFGERFFYRLQCETVVPSYELTVKEGEFVMPADKPLEIPVTVDRRDGFSGGVDFHVQGLPDGLVAEPARSEKDGDSAKSVTIRISGTLEKGFSGPIRISALAENADAIETQFVRLSIPNADFSTASLWLTVPATEPVKVENNPAPETGK